LDEWKYPGLIMSDWFGTYDGVASVKARMGIEMPFPAARGPKLLQAIKEGKLSESDLDGPLTQVIDFLKLNGAPKEEDRAPERASPSGPSERASIIRQAAADGLVLLKNDGILPINPSNAGKIAVMGSLATDRVLAHLIRPSYVISPLEGLQQAFADHADKLVHAHGVQTHKMLPMLEAPYTDKVDFTFWNRGDRESGGKSVATESNHEAHVAILLRPIPGLGKEYEIEMNTSIKVPESGKYILSVVACSNAEVFIDGESVYTYTPKGVMDIQQQLFYSADFEQTFEATFDAGREYAVHVIAQSQEQVGHEPVGQGLRFGIVKQVTREESLAEAVALAKESDIVLCFVGTTAEWEMEGIDRKDIALPAGQEELVKAVLEANKNVVVVNQSGAAVDLSCASGARAILHAHFSGCEAGNGESLRCDEGFWLILCSYRRCHHWQDQPKWPIALYVACQA
jgi:beta-glucosidase